MGRTIKPSPKRLLGSTLMMLTLGWLTVSLPFVNDARQLSQQAAAQRELPASPAFPAEEEADNSFSSTTEEKHSQNGSIEEYLHSSTSTLDPGLLLSSKHAETSADKYRAFYGELVCPPPDHC